MLDGHNKTIIRDRLRAYARTHVYNILPCVLAYKICITERC